ncbi:MAG: divalent-cation tolerance protein CutA, partial [Pseudomonadota bacterium]|nr:divalent-cation tolerance protein CutA [Pseudomonadota bacterium]
FPGLDEARRVGRELVERRLAACVNIIPGMTAIFEWKGKLDEVAEIAMLIKTRREMAADVMSETRKLHPYTVPALLVIDLAGADEEFAAWIAGQTSPGGARA